MTKPKVLIFAPREEPKNLIASIEGAGYEVAYGERAWQHPRSDHESDFATAARDAVALAGTSIRHTPVSRRVMESSQRLRIVAKYTVGVDDIDVEAATELGIMVCHAPTEANCFGVAEQTIAFILALLKKIARARRRREGRQVALAGARHHYFSAAANPTAGRASPSGLVGLGRIGTRVAQLLAPWRVRIVAYDPHIPAGEFSTRGCAVGGLPDACSRNPT